MVNYYRMFNLSLAKEKGIITDEMVKKAYLDRKQKYLELRDKNNNKNSVKINNEQLIAFMEDSYMELLEDGYYAIKTANAREHYDELLQMLEEHIQRSKLEELKPITNLKDVIQSINKKTVKTTELIRKIRADAEAKYPVSQYDNDIDSRNNENEI